MNEKKTAEDLAKEYADEFTDTGLYKYNNEQKYNAFIAGYQVAAAQETATLREENERLKEALKELIPIAERALNYTWIPETEQDLQDAINDEFVNGPNRNYKIAIENAKKLTG